MAEKKDSSAHLWRFILIFCVTIVVLLGVWWAWLLPAYSWVLQKICVFLAGTILGVPITNSYLETKGLFNTESLLTFVVGDRYPAFPIALLITNVPPFVALVLATSNIVLARRLRVLAIGCGILMLSHILFITILLRFQQQLLAHPEIPTAIMQVVIATLPFLLWIRLAYWDRIVTLLNEKGD